MPFVLDASVTLAWALDEHKTEAAEQALRRLLDDTAVAPAIWWFEVRNVLIGAERRGRRTDARSAAFLRALARLPIEIDRGPDETMVVGLARRHGLTVYDAAYLELAIRRQAPLVTLAAALLRAAAVEGVKSLGE